MKRTVTSNSENETLKAAEEFAAGLKAGDVVALHGDLGAGKTVFVKGAAKAMGVVIPVTSPTFTLIQEYKGRLPLYHMDLYRMQSKKEILDIGAEDYLYGDGICLVEWAEKLEDILPENATTVTIEKTGASKRVISFQNLEGK